MSLTSADLLELLPSVENLVLEMGEYSVTQWDKPVLHNKGDRGDLITDTDIYIERQLRQKLPQIYPASVVGEEEGGEIPNEAYWLVDPIDGTKHFAHKMPSFFVQLALVENGEPILGIVYDPLTKQMFSASKGNGTYLNGEKMNLQNTVTLEKAIVDIDFGGGEDFEWSVGVFKKLVEKCYRVRVSASRFAPYLVTGGINAYLVINTTTKAWDQLPRRILFTECGYEPLEFDRNGRQIRIFAEKSLAKIVYDLINY